jgi:hypothetical protein
LRGEEWKGSVRARGSLPARIGNLLGWACWDKIFFHWVFADEHGRIVLWPTSTEAMMITRTLFSPYIYYVTFKKKSM